MTFFSTTLLGLALALAGPTAGGRAAPVQEKPADIAAEYKALDREFDDAQDAYYAPLSKAKTAEEREKVQLDPEKEPSKVFVPRFQDLALRAKGTETGARALVWIVANSREMESPAAIAAAEELLAAYRDSPVLRDLAQQLEYRPGTIGIARAREVLGKIAASSPHDDVRAAALFVQGALHMEDDSGSKDEAKLLFQRVAKDYAKTAFAKRAQSSLFELDRLQIGMAAPDFETIDETGKPFKLSDYRGKVVVLDFWGFW